MFPTVFVFPGGRGTACRTDEGEPESIRMSDRLVPDDFTVPVLLETDRFRLRPLVISDVVKDYDAMMSRVEPDLTLTIEQNLADLGWHQVEFSRRTSFTFTVMNFDESQCLGCVYIYPPRESEAGFDARVHFWVRKSEWERGLDPILFSTVKQWIAEQWPWKQVTFPGRDAATGALLPK